jgi:hypothetical protein
MPNIMESIDYQATSSTPLVKLIDNKKLLIQGRSISENEITFYAPLIAWASQVQSKLLEVEANLEYINSRCSKKLFMLFKALDNNIGIKRLIIHWHYDEGDEDALLKGHIFADALTHTEFHIHKNH